MGEISKTQGQSVTGSTVTEFRGRRIPLPADLAGYGAIMRAFDLEVPLHHEMVAAAPRNAQRKEEGRRIVPIVSKPADDIVSHIGFASKDGGVRFSTSQRAFQAVDPSILDQADRYVCQRREVLL